jgi:hypothetical protein
MLSLTALAGAVLLAPAGVAWADPTPSADPSATASPAATAGPSPDATPSEEPPPSGCEQNPEICQSGGAPGTTTDCGQVGPGGQPASPPPPGTVCIASGLNPGNPDEVTQVTSGAGSPTLPRTGPAPLVPTLALGGWLLLLGVLAVAAGRRRTAQV